MRHAVGQFLVHGASKVVVIGFPYYFPSILVGFTATSHRFHLVHVEQSINEIRVNNDIARPEGFKEARGKLI